MNYPRYQPRPQRPRGAGAFFDWTVFVERHGMAELKCCRLDRRRERQASGAFAPAEAAKPRPAP